MFSVFLTKLTVSSCQRSDRGSQINHHLDNTTIGEYSPYTLRVHMKLYIDLSSLIGLEQQNNTSSSQITWRPPLTCMITSTAFRYQTWPPRKMVFRQPRDLGEVSDPFPPGELSTACPPVSAAQQVSNNPSTIC